MTLGMMTTSMELMQIMITMVKSLCMDGPGWTLSEKQTIKDEGFSPLTIDPWNAV